MTQFSANLGFLWTELRLPEAINAAAAAGFAAVECHWPYDVPADETRAALEQTGLKMLGINTVRGDINSGENGLAAVVGRQSESRAAIDQAVDYARQIKAHNIHVMAGVAAGDAARDVFLSNLDYACHAAAPHSITIVIEPLNHHDAPGYFLRTTDQARQIIDHVDAVNLKLMFDCYHVQLMEGDVVGRLEACMDIIGHIQFASVPGRGAPDHGEVDYADVFTAIDRLGYHAPLGAEYKPMNGDTNASLNWLANTL